jgi:ankyrin repeat protein
MDLQSYLNGLSEIRSTLAPLSTPNADHIILGNRIRSLEQRLLDLMASKATQKTTSASQSATEKWTNINDPTSASARQLIDVRGFSLLHRLVETDHLSELSKLLAMSGWNDAEPAVAEYAAASSPNIDLSAMPRTARRDIDGRTALLLAIARGNEQAATLLLNDVRSGDISEEDRNKCNALHLAAHAGSTDLCRRIIQKGKIIVYQ